MGYPRSPVFFECLYNDFIDGGIIMKKIKITPVKKKTAPQYPNQYSVDLNHLLLANKPLRWNAAPVAGTVLSAVIMLGLAGCSAASEHELVSMGTTAPPLYTPFFEHGKGTGVYGCVSVNAPMFLSEDDAFAIIKDEFAKSGLTVEKGGGTAPNITLPNIVDTIYDSKTETHTGTLDFDFSVEGSNIVMEYVSSDDLDAWTDQNFATSVSTKDYKEAAKILNESLNNAYLGSVHGVFYDPAETPQYHYSEEDKAADREASANALREQVKDFLAWLSAQGII